MNLTISKFITRAGTCSRRRAVDLVKDGRVTLNGTVVREPWIEVTQEDLVCVNGRPIMASQRMRYILMNKPKDCITSVSDDRGRRTVMDLIGSGVSERLFPVGRLDRNTTGVLLLTNDGGLAHRLMHPKFETQKTYHVTLDRPCMSKDVQALKQGLQLEDGVLQCDRVLLIPGTGRKQLFLTIHSGKYRVIRRAFEHLNYMVKKLNRSIFASLTPRGLARGQWRELKKSEITELKSGNDKAR